MRHAKSDWSRGLADFDRPLSSRGERNAASMADWILAQDLAPEHCLSSSARRTRETVGHLVDAGVIEEGLVSYSDDLYLGSAGAWLEQVRGFSAARALICGHNPGLDYLVEHLAPDDVTTTTDGKLMTTAAIAHFEVSSWADISPASSRLVQLVRPRELEA